MKGGFTFCINNPPQAFYPSQKGGLIGSTEKAQTQAPRLPASSCGSHPSSLLEDHLGPCGQG